MFEKLRPILEGPGVSSGGSRLSQRVTVGEGCSCRVGGGPLCKSIQ